MGSITGWLFEFLWAVDVNGN